jgi:hypothetical protein
MASNRGPNAISPEYQHQNGPSSYSGGGGGTSSHAGVPGGSWSNAGHSSLTPSVTINSVPGPTSGSGGVAVSDGTYEKNLVLELCPPGGMKPVPPPDKLASFARTCASLNADLVCPVLLDCLEEGQPWVIRAKALCAMETAIANGTGPSGMNPYRDFFFACHEEVAPLTSHPRSAIHEPAKRVLELLGVDASSAPSGHVAAAAPVVAAPNLLDFDDEPASTQPPLPPPTEAPPPPPSNGNNMFGGMQVKSTAASTKVAAPPVAAPPASAAPNLLDFDDAPTPLTGSDANREKKMTETAVPSTSSMFDQLSVKASEATMPNGSGELASPFAAATSNSGEVPASAFGFINRFAARSAIV